MQTMYATIHDELRELLLPNPEDFVLPGLKWGAFDELLTPAYWRGQAWQHAMLGTYNNLRLGRSLVEEITACLLGGFGMRADLGLAAFSRLRDRELIITEASAIQIERALAEPFSIGGRQRRYRFPRQKAGYLSECLKQIDISVDRLDDRQLRSRLIELPGIGLKTASWIVRNYRTSDHVAVIDVHILRAGRCLGIFAEHEEPQNHYLSLETKFLEFARAIETKAAALDGLMWDYMRRLSSAVRSKPQRQTELFDVSGA